jgi:hypothetical protein
LARSSEFTRNPIPKFLEPLKQLAQQELDHQVPQEFQNIREKIQHDPLVHGHKKSGWRVRLPTTCGESRFAFPRRNNQKAKNKRQTEVRPAYAVNELPQPQLLAALGFWKTNP